MTNESDSFLPKLGCHVQTWGAVRLRAAGSNAVEDLHFESRAPFHRALTDIKLAGFVGVEVFDGDLLEWDRRALQVGNMGLEICGVYTGGYLIHDEIYPDERRRFENVCEVAARHGAMHVVFGGGVVRSSGVASDDLGRIAKRLDDLSAHAQNLGLTVHYHPHPIPGGHSGNDIETILSETAIPICPDFAVLKNGGVDPVAFVERHASRIRYAHFKDSRGSLDVEVGQGDIDMRAILKALAASGTISWCVAELDASHTLAVESARAMAAYLRQAVAEARADAPREESRP